MTLEVEVYAVNRAPVGEIKSQSHGYPLCDAFHSHLRHGEAVHSHFRWDSAFLHRNKVNGGHRSYECNPVFHGEQPQQGTNTSDPSMPETERETTSNTTSASAKAPDTTFREPEHRHTPSLLRPRPSHPPPTPSGSQVTHLIPTPTLPPRCQQPKEASSKPYASA
ncbi:hypothetical protein B9Z19DRAFT_1066842 [Tuber borchii]|uniref:Uncharacterized protein n=1 Tax=Tuber borchii TaxID=42251 RepID=A0A2T6ZKY3_TUBBO|nr:hypothetical protein B9Z19DRAFT_1066842 [Tuber borchii]